MSPIAQGSSDDGSDASAPREAAAADPRDAARSLAALSAEYWDHTLDETPSYCTALGLDRGLDRLDENNDAARARRAAARESLRLRLEAIAPDALAGEDRITRTVLQRQLAEALEADRHRGWEWALNPLLGVHLALQEVVERHPLRTPADADALVSRYEAVPSAL